MKRDVCSAVSFASTDNTRASCPLVAIETQIRKARILNAHEGEVGVVSSPLERAAVRVPKSEHDTYQMLYTSRHGFGSRKGFQILVFATDISEPALAATEHSRKLSRSGRSGKLNTRFSEWVERYFHGPLCPHIMRHGVRLTCTDCKTKSLHTSRTVSRKLQGH